jgi:hypothetical protein
MITKRLFLKKVVFICSLLILFSFHSRLCSQIIYTDIPDATPNATFSLDLNNDLIDDYIFHYGSGVMCSPQNNNAYSGKFAGGLHLPWALSVSHIICDTLATWYDATNPGTMASGTSTGYWVGETNKYLALKLVVGTNTYYGWARFDVSATSSSFTIKDYAFESTPDACILTGQTILGMNENSIHKDLSIFPNPSNSQSTIQIIGNLQDASLTIYNSFGQMIKQVNNISGQSVSLSRDNLSSGVYLVKLIEKNKKSSIKKLILID